MKRNDLTAAERKDAERDRRRKRLAARNAHRKHAHTNLYR